MKARTIYVWEGPETITITRGIDMQRYETSKGSFYKGLVRHKGLFGSFLPVENIPELYFGEVKKLYVKDKILPGWNAMRIKMDYMSKEPYIVDVPANVTAQVEGLRNEVIMWRKRCLLAEEKLYDLEHKDRFEESVKKRLKFIGEAKTLQYSMEGMGGYGYPGFGSRWGLGGVLPPTQPPSEE